MSSPTDHVLPQLAVDPQLQAQVAEALLTRPASSSTSAGPTGVNVGYDLAS